MEPSMERQTGHKARSLKLPAGIRMRIGEAAPYAHLLYVAGSRAYGLATPDSDWDVRLTIPPTRDEILFQTDFGERHLDGLDVTIRSVKKTLVMLWRGNPNIIELFALPADCLQYSDAVGRQIIGLKSQLLSQDCLVHMQGYMMHARSIAFAPEAGTARARKAMMHAVRVHRMAMELAQTGRLNVCRGMDRDELLDIRANGRTPSELDHLLDVHDGQPAPIDGGDLPEPLDEKQFRELARPILMQSAGMATD